MTSQTQQQNTTTTTEKDSDKFFPIPLKHVSARQLEKIPIYLLTENEYCLYSTDGLGFNNEDRQRLLDSHIKYIFISVDDHEQYFHAMSDAMLDVANDTSIQYEDKVDMLHGASLGLANKLNSKPLDKTCVDQTIKQTSSSAQMIMNGVEYKDLFDMCAKDPEDVKNLVAMSATMQGFAHKLGLTDKHALGMMGTGAMLHDIGKVFLPKHNRTIEQIRSHVKLGVQHLDTIPGIPMEIRNIVAEHHERIDGSGYPYGLKGDDISLMGQIAGLAHTFHTLINQSEHKSEKERIADALNILEEKLNKKFDNNMLKSFIAFVSGTLLEAAEDKAKLSMFNVSVLDISHRRNNPNGRRHERLYFRSKGSLEILHLKGERWAVKSSHDIIMHNISQSGMGFMTYKRLQENEIVLTKLYVSNQNEPVCLLGKVARVHEVTKDLFIIGAIFFEANSHEATKRLFEKFNK